ncbi:MAG: DUF4330 domain-containing protein [Cyanobacteria bacterium P01_H01_bin.130]
MQLLDARGRLFGKVSILDLGAALTILAVIFGILFLPGGGGSVAQVGANKAPVEIDLIVRGLSVRDPQVVIDELLEEQSTKIVIRNQPYGTIKVKSVEMLERTTAVPQPDGSVKALPDPRPGLYNTDMYIVLEGDAIIRDDGPVLGNSKIKIGTPVELEGKTYGFNTSAIDVRILE